MSILNSTASPRPPTRSTRVLFALIGSICLCATAQGGIVNLTSQERSVAVHFTDNTPPQIQQATDFSPFNAQVGFPKTNAIADQHSTLTVTPDGAIFDAVSNVRGSSPTVIFGSTFHVGFDVTRPVDYRLSYGFGAAGDGSDTPPTALFTGPFGTRDIHLGVNETGVLQPGSYQLQVDASGGHNITYVVNFAAVPFPTALSATLTMLPVMIITALYKRPRPRINRT